MNKYWECDYMENGYVSLVKEPDGWTEIDEPGEMTEVEQKAAAYDILTGGAE